MAIRTREGSAERPVSGLLLVWSSCVDAAPAEAALAEAEALWSVLTALLAHPGQAVSPDDIARRAWGVDYHAVRHRSRLVVSIKRLRDALGAELIATVDGGYALTAPTWLVLE
jgi:DNA-binding response OmpR family regulator